MAGLWTVDGLTVSHPALRAPLLLPVPAVVDRRFSVVAYTDLTLSLTTPDNCSVLIDLSDGTARCRVEFGSRLRAETLPDWVVCRMNDFHVSGYRIRRPYTLVSESLKSSPVVWRCRNDPDKLFMIGANEWISGGLIEIPFTRGASTALVTVWAPRPSVNTLHTLTCVDGAGAAHTLVLECVMDCIQRITYVVK